MNNRSPIMLPALLVLLGASAVAQATESFSLVSGNGPVGTLDPQISMLVGPANQGFGFAFTAADFESANSGAPANIINRHGAWIAGLGDGTARWIASNPSGASEGSTALYSHAFQVSTQDILGATLDFHFAVDNVLGTSPNTGLFLNGQPLPGTTGGTFTSVFHFNGLAVGDLLVPGLNHLQVCAVDQGGPAGLLYQADFTIEEDQTVDARELPSAYALHPAAPNPFNPTTTISYSLLETGPARLSVHNLLGREVALLADGMQESGTHRVVFDAAALPSGVYIARLESRQGVEARKLVLVK